MTRTMRSALANAFRRAALPIGCYYTVTLGLPLANGAAHSGPPFVTHALAVLIVPPLFIVLLCAIRTGARAILHTVGARRAQR